MSVKITLIALAAGLVCSCSMSAKTHPKSVQSKAWYTIDEVHRYVETEQMIWQWTDAKMAEYPLAPGAASYGISGVTKMLIKSTNHNQLYNPDPHELNVAKIGSSETYTADNAFVGWIDTFKTLATTNDYVTIQVNRSTANTPPHMDWQILQVRYYRAYPVMEIYSVLNKGGTWNFSFRPGELTNQDNANFFIHGAPGITHDDWIKAKAAARSDLLSVLLPTFRTTLEACTYKGYYIMGVYNVRNNEGVGFVMSLSDYTVYNDFYPNGYKDIKFWLHDVAGTGWSARTGNTQWFYAVTGGPDEIDSIGKMIVDHGGVPPGRASRVSARAE